MPPEYKTLYFPKLTSGVFRVYDDISNIPDLPAINNPKVFQNFEVNETSDPDKLTSQLYFALRYGNTNFTKNY